jgi:tRNA A-37 threonylcarbamoyl transferase component Bud32
MREILGSRYEVVEKLGAGAFGEVYRAKDTTLGREVAIKRIRLDAFAESDQLEEVKQRFLREAQVAAQLRHANIITTHDINATAGMSFIVMELVQGETLQSLVKRKGRLGLAETIELFSQAAAALDHAHENGVVHRDIKPANMMIEPSGNVKVMDFGIAKTNASSNITATGAIVGTPNYMSPEQARGEKLDGRSDLFSLGCILYECLTGTKAFRGENVTAVLMQILTAEPPVVDMERAGLPAGVGDVLKRALAKEPGARFPSGGALVQALRAAAEGAGAAVAAAPPPATPAVSPPAPAAAVASGTVVSAPPPTPIARRVGRAGLAAAVLAFAVVGILLARSGSVDAPAPAGGGGDGTEAGSMLVRVEEVGFLGRLVGKRPLVHVTIPEGTSLPLELVTDLSSATAQTGDAFEAHTTAPVSIEDREAVPAGSVIHGHVSHAAAAGKVKGVGELTLEFDTLVVGEARLPIATAPFHRKARTTARRDAKTVGIGAGAGALVGGLLGGKKGALIGGAVGGGAGGAKVLTSRGEDVSLPVGTSLEVALDQAIVVTREQPEEES